VLEGELFLKEKKMEIRKEKKQKKQNRNV